MSPKGVFVVNGQGCKVINIWGRGGGLIIKLITTRTSYTIKYCDVLKSKLWSAVLIIHKINVKVKLHEQNQLLYKLAIVNEALLYKKQVNFL